MTVPEPIVISDRVVIPCPECGEQIPVPIVVTVEGEPGEQALLADPDMTDLWAHVWTHTPELDADAPETVPVLAPGELTPAQVRDRAGMVGTVLVLAAVVGCVLGVAWAWAGGSL